MKTGSRVRRITVIAVLPSVLGISALFSGAGVIAALLAVTLPAILLWFFTKNPQPETGMPSRSVSCCHYLGAEGNQQKTH